MRASMRLRWQRCERVPPRPGLFPFFRYFPSAYALGYAVSSLRDLNRDAPLLEALRSDGDTQIPNQTMGSLGHWFCRENNVRERPQSHALREDLSYRRVVIRRWRDGAHPLEVFILRNRDSASAH